MRLPRTLVACVLPTLLLLIAAAACGDGGSQDARVTIEPLRTVAASATIEVADTDATPRLGGKPAAPTETPTLLPAPTQPPPEEPAPAASSTVAPPAPVPTATPVPAPVAPTSGRWIDVNVTSFAVRLMEGETLVSEIAPVGVGVQVDTGAYLSTQTGLFAVNGKIADLAYDAPYDTYISHWVGFDAQKDNGFHSFLKDAMGNVVDASTGRVSNGCIRTGDAEAIFAFAEIGMPVFVHL